MSEIKYDIKTQEKLYKQYNEVISKYSLENKNLKEKLIDSKETVALNHRLLYDIVNSSNIDKKEINKLIDKIKNILEKNEKLIEMKKKIEINTYKLRVLMENIAIEINEELNDVAIKNNISRNEISQRDNIIKKLKQDLERVRKNALFKEARTEIFISPPTKNNITKNEELIDAKYIISKVSDKHSKNKKIAKKLKNHLDKLKTELNELKNKIQTEKNDDNFYLKIEGYNIVVDNEEEDYEEEEEKEDSSEEDDIKEEGKNKKKKEKELYQLKDKYDQLKMTYDNSQNRINEYKKKFKKIKEEIDKIEVKINTK